MNTNVKNIYEIVEDMKENLTDYQYKTIMDNLMALNNEKEEKEVEVEEETDEDLKSVFITRLYLLQRYSTDIS